MYSLSWIKDSIRNKIKNFNSCFHKLSQNGVIGLGFVDDNNVDEDGNDGCDDKHCKVVVEIDQHCGVGGGT